MGFPTFNYRAAGVLIEQNKIVNSLEIAFKFNYNSGMKFSILRRS